MDFGALLHYAKKKNDAATKDEHGKYYSTKYAPPKKESKESKQLSSNIQKFLKKREAEESEKKRQEREKLSNLLAMRDEKSKNKIRKMLKVTKSANKSVLEDAKDCDNTDVTLDGPEQPDGDDYGYVSTEANAFYQKYIEKVKDVHEDKGFAPSRPQSLRDLSGTKERVKAAITREREEAKTHTRQRLSSVQNTSSSSSSRTPRDSSVARSYTSSKTLYNPEAERRQEEEEQQQKKPKVKRPPQPPPMDFQALLRLAEKKQHEPISIAMPEKKKEPERLLSAREKRELEERQKWKEQRAQRDKQREVEAKSKDQRKDNQPGVTSSSQSQQPRMEPNGRIPKLNKAGTAGKAGPMAAPAPPATSESKAKPTSDSLKRPAPPAAAGSGGSSAKISATGKSSSSQNGNGAQNAAKRAASVVNTQKPTSSTSRNPYAAINKTGVTREFPPREPAAKTRPFPPNDDQQHRRQTALDARAKSVPFRRKQAEMGNKREWRYQDKDAFMTKMIPSMIQSSMTLSMMVIARRTYHRTFATSLAMISAGIAIWTRTMIKWSPASLRCNERSLLARNWVCKKIWRICAWRRCIKRIKWPKNEPNVLMMMTNLPISIFSNSKLTSPFAQPQNSLSRAVLSTR